MTKRIIYRMYRNGFKSRYVTSKIYSQAVIYVTKMP